MDRCFVVDFAAVQVTPKNNDAGDLWVTFQFLSGR